MDRTLPRSIYVVGVHSSGKTTLVEALLHALSIQTSGPVHVSEVARTVMATQGFTRDNVKTIEMQEAILRYQIHIEQDKRQREEHLICDRSGIDPLAYARIFELDQTTRLQRLLHESGLLDRYRSSLFILLEPVKDFLFDDGIRMVTKEVEEWKRQSEEFKATLHHLHIPFIPIGEERKYIRDRVQLVLSMLSGTSLPSTWNIRNDEELVE
ncbi:hypothetical protein BT69DRAFT_1300037 [Atractiella rhizophila]|nr:hypothetical protein BT69DRAFT_1300037 [Atractiella rhizophila]